ncbi:MAG: oligopeptide/dipeptide ABC transporter ATP-binding protein, partial [Thermomicrobiales bacterium]
MYAGKIVEQGTVEEIFADPGHPYTIGLIGAVPSLREGASPEPIPGSPPDLVFPPTGCRFHPRCQFAQPICGQREPLVRSRPSGHSAACHFFDAAPVPHRSNSETLQELTPG